MTDRKKHGGAFWAIVAVASIAAVALYVLCYPWVLAILIRTESFERWHGCFAVVFTPLDWIDAILPAWLHDAWSDYDQWCLNVCGITGVRTSIP